MNKQPLFFLSVFCLLCLGACTTNSPGKLSLQLSNQKFQTESRMIISGKAFTPNKQVAITIMNFPKREGNISRTASADASGNFTLTESFAYRVVGRDEEFINILVVARDITTGQFVIENTSPWPYLIKR